MHTPYQLAGSACHILVICNFLNANASLLAAGTFAVLLLRL
jgi:hypothetical protein